MSEEADQSEKTEDPSHKRLEDAHQKGDVPKSQELSSALFCSVARWSSA
jgi:flagellar biosynthetic protein FlhB